MNYCTVLVLATTFCVVSCKPLEVQDVDADTLISDNIETQFLNTDFKPGSYSDLTLERTKRSEDGEDCERLELCRLHARSGQSLFAAFQLYFVNRETARLWDHRSRSLRECNNKYSCSK